MASHTIYCRIPTPQEKKEMERQELQRKQNQNRKFKPTTSKKTDTRSKAKSEWKSYSEMTPEEKRNIDNILRKTNNQLRQRYGIGSDLACGEFR